MPAQILLACFGFILPVVLSYWMYRRFRFEPDDFVKELGRQSQRIQIREFVPEGFCWAGQELQEQRPTAIAGGTLCERRAGRRGAAEEQGRDAPHHGSANTSTELPRLKSSCVFPPAATATYCLLPTM